MDAILIERLELGDARHGATVAIKDSIDVAGSRTRCGSAVLADAPPALRNADVVARLLARGARIVGEANMHRFTYGGNHVDQAYEPRNPAFCGAFRRLIERIGGCSCGGYR